MSRTIDFAFCLVVTAAMAGWTAPEPGANGRDAPGADAAGQVVLIRYSLPRDSRVSINLYDASGHVVRELVLGALRAKGLQEEAWDGLDSAGRPVPASGYAWKLLATQGLKAEYLLTLGTNPSPPWDTWPGNHGGASAVAVDETGLYVAGGCGEGDPLLVKQTLDGRRLWTVPNWLEGWQGGYSLSISGSRLFLRQQNGVMQRINALTGAPEAHFSILWSPEDRKGADGKDREFHEIMDSAAGGGQLVVSYTEHNAIRWVNPEDGKVLDEAAIPAPRGVAVGSDGRVLVISQNRVVVLTRDNKTPRPLTGELVSPFRLAVDPATGEVIVAERGASQQVKRFSPSGKLMAAYGIPGGRPREGRYDPAGFADVGCLCSDGKGGFIIVEPNNAPRRVARFDRDGRLVREWYGGQQYANFACADPDDPSSVWLESHWGELIQAKVDYERRIWKVYATYRYAGLAHDLITNHHHGNDGWYVRHHAGATYLCRNDHPCVLRVDEGGRRLVPLTALTVVKPWGSPGAYLMECREHAGGDIVLWADTNGDGQASFDEMRKVDIDPWGGEHGGFIGPDLTYYRYPGDDILWTFRPAWTKAGLPVYDYDQCKHPLVAPKDMGFWGGGGAALDEAGNVFAFGATGRHGPQEKGWRVLKWGPEGIVRWVVGHDARGTRAGPGEMRNPYRILGTAHGCVLVNDYADSMTHVWDQDGLWVGRLFDQPDLKAAPAEAYQTCGENFGGSLWVNPKTGAVLYYAGGQNNTPVFRITGWDQFQRQAGRVVLAPDIATRLQARAEEQAGPPGVIHIPFLREVRTEGDLKKWQDVKPIVIRDGDHELAKLYLAWNANGLYAAFDVTTDRPWKSGSTASLAFEGGAAVDVSVGPVDPDRKKPAAGDTRIVAAPLRQGSRIVEFQPVLAPDLKPADRAPATYETGQGKVTFDRVAPLPGDWIGCQEKPGGQGYVVEMRIPLHGPLEPAPGQKLRLDASVILSNLQGTHITARVPWHSQDPDDAITNDTYLESLLRPANWGYAVLE